MGGGASAITGLEFGYPLLVKAVSGGGGWGIRLVERAEDLATMVSAARREALPPLATTVFTSNL